MHTFSYWKSIYTGQIYRMPADWLPSFGGWEKVKEPTAAEKKKWFIED